MAMSKSSINFTDSLSRCHLQANDEWLSVTKDAIIITHPPCREALIMEEREFFDESTQKKPASLNCPSCHQADTYEVTWVVRTKKRQLSGRADERDRARFAKAKSYMLRKDDMMACKNVRCRKRFEISGLQSVVFTE
jgi:hypothetical protein